MKLHHYNEAYAWMVRREKFANGTPEPKPERTFADKLRTLKEVSKGIAPESRLRLLDYFIQEALEKNQITKDQASGIYDQLQQDKDKIREQIDAYERENFSDGSLSVQTLNPAFPTKDPTSTDFKPLDVPGAIIPPLALGATAKRIKDTFFSKDKGDDKKEIVPSDKSEPPMKQPDEEPPVLQELAEDVLIDTAVNRLRKKEMNPEKRDARTALARNLNLPVTRSGMLEIRKGNYFNDRLQTLKEKGVNFDGYYSIPEIANLLGTKSSSGIQSYVNDKNIPTIKKGLYKLVKFNDFLNVYQGTKKRVDVAPPTELGTLARTDFLKEVGGNFYQRFKDMRRPKSLPPEVKTIYEKYNLGEIEGGHPFPIEFFTKKFGKNNTLQKDRQFDWIYRNKDKLFSKNNLVFQSKEVNKLFRNSIKDLKKLYKELGPYVDKYEGKGAVTNKKDISKIEEINNDIIEIIAKSEFDAKKYIDESDNKVDLERFKTGGLHGALFNTDTGEVSLYTGVGEGAGFEAIGKEPTDVKLKLAGDYADIINNVITDETDRKIFTNYLDKDLLPKFQEGGPVYGKYARQIAGLS